MVRKMLEKKTTKELYKWIDSLYTDDEYNLNKVWVSQESLIKTLNKFFNHGNEREMIILNAILKDLNISNKKLNEDEK